jgi:uncharacterized membrane protein
MSLALLFHYLFTAQHVSNISSSIFRSLRIICGFIALVRCVLVLQCGLAGVVLYPYGGILMPYGGILMPAEALVLQPP